MLLLDLSRINNRRGWRRHIGFMNAVYSALQTFGQLDKAEEFKEAYNKLIYHQYSGHSGNCCDADRKHLAEKFGIKVEEFWGN